MLSGLDLPTPKYTDSKFPPGVNELVSVIVIDKQGIQIGFSSRIQRSHHDPEKDKERELLKESILL